MTGACHGTARTGYDAKVQAKHTLVVAAYLLLLLSFFLHQRGAARWTTMPSWWTSSPSKEPCYLWRHISYYSNTFFSLSQKGLLGELRCQADEPRRQPSARAPRPIADLSFFIYVGAHRRRRPTAWADPKVHLKMLRVDAFPTLPPDPAGSHSVSAVGMLR